MVVVLDDSSTERIVSCARVVVGAVGAFCGEAAFEGFSHRFGQERPGDGIGRRESVPVKCGDAWRRPVVGGEDAELVIGEASRRGGVRSGGVGVSCEESASGASEGLGAGRFFRDEAVAGVVIICPSTQQPCGSSTSVKRYGYGGATRRRWRRFPGQRRPRRRSAAMRAVATKSLVIWPRACWPEGCFFGHWRSGTTFSLFTGGATRRAVRKHRAPKGALIHKSRESCKERTRQSESTERQKVH